MRRPCVINLAAGFAALALLTTACADSDSGGTVAAGDEPASNTETLSNDWALEYTGGTAGEADDSLEPIVIGYVNQEGGVPAFPEATVGTEAAVEYINGELGGIGGHPLRAEDLSGAGRGGRPEVRNRDGQRPQRPGRAHRRAHHRKRLALQGRRRQAAR